MRLGVVFPHTEIGVDPIAIRHYAQAVEELGYDHILAWDRILNPQVAVVPKAGGGALSSAMTYHEPTALFAYLAAVTNHVELAPFVVLAQRQTVLVAKQAAELDVLSGGRLRLGISVGWNEGEFEAMGQGFHDRGRRIEEQVEVLRALWANDTVDYQGEWHRIAGLGMAPRPARGTIPLWFGGAGMPPSAGGRNDAVLRRVARLGDGWFAQDRGRLDQEHVERIQQFRSLLKEAGRDAERVGIQVRVNLSNGLDVAVQEALAWQTAGATHVAVNTVGGGYRSIDEHLEALRMFKNAAMDA